jgi:broad-specificity NMP kinase
VKILVTGQAGSGKSSVAAELVRRGFTAYDTDSMREVTGFDSVSGEPLSLEDIRHPVDFGRVAWNWRLDELEKLLESADDVFICAITSNTVENLHLFDRAFVLVTDRETLARRLRERTNNTFGKDPAEAEPVLAHNDVIADEWRARGGIPIDSARPLDHVVDEILRHVSGLRPRLLPAAGGDDEQAAEHERDSSEL